MSQLQTKGEQSRSYFVIVDISGYTAYLANNELEHAGGILAEITELLIDKLSAPFQFVELEGDAVFVHAPEREVEDPEHLVEIVEACYAAFLLLREQMVANTSCTCAACRAIKDLDLKCVAHFGPYAPQDTPRGTKLVGPDVILVHRLLKNSVIDSTGIAAYALVTHAFISRTKSADFGVHAPLHMENYEQLGEVQGRVIDLRAAVKRYTGAERYYVTTADADMDIVTDIPAPKTIVWGYAIDPTLRMKWQTDITSVENKPDEGGRTGIGTASHCDHGSYRLDHRFIDWRPFDYMTTDSSSSGKSIVKPPSCRATFTFEETSSKSCRVSFRVRVHDRGIRMRVLLFFAKPLIIREWRGHFRRLAKLLAVDASKIGST